MLTSRTDYFGVDNFKKVTQQIDPDRQQHYFNVEILDRDYDVNMSFEQVYCEHLRARPGNQVEVLYSGGIDSEMILAVCRANAIPCRAVTMRLLIKGIAVNTHDLYHAERYTRQNGIAHSIVDLHVDRFYETGDYLRYAEPYLNKEFHVSTHLWLLEQCATFPVIGGGYPWPWTHGPRVVSPLRNTYNHYDHFMQDRGIAGIGNMQSHSLASVMYFIEAHLGCIGKYKDLTPINMSHFRHDVNARLGIDLEPRLRTYGWDQIDSSVFDKDNINRDLIKLFGAWHNSITWNQSVARALGGVPGTWDRFD